jgi:hypothetical protein
VSLQADRFACKPVIRGELTGSSTCSAAGFTATSGTPVLVLCRELVAAGFYPDQPLEVYRGDTLALRIRSIGEAAALELNGEATGFRSRRQPDAAPPVGETVPQGAAIGARRAAS